MGRLDSMIKFNISSAEKDKFQRKFPNKGQQSKVMRALVQLVLSDKIARSDLKYQEQL